MRKIWNQIWRNFSSRDFAPIFWNFNTFCGLNFVPIFSTLPFFFYRAHLLHPCFGKLFPPRLFLHFTFLLFYFCHKGDKKSKSVKKNLFKNKRNLFYKKNIYTSFQLTIQKINQENCIWEIINKIIKLMCLPDTVWFWCSSEVEVVKNGLKNGLEMSPYFLGN